MKYVVAIILVMFASPALAQAPRCTDWTVVREQAKTIPVFSPIRALKGEAVKLAVELFDSIPPETNSGFTVAAVIDIADEAGGGGLVLVGNESQLCGSFRIAKDRWGAFLRATEGYGA
jgi:hypothetical protein